MTARLEGRRSWSVTQDDNGHRAYKIIWGVETTSAEDGPHTVMKCPGLAVMGSIWNYGNDMDPWALCWPNMRVTERQKKPGPTRHWNVEQTFKTMPLGMDGVEGREDPLLDPQKVSGNFARYSKEIGYGYASLAAAAVGGERTKALATYSHEPLRGIQGDVSRPTVRIEQNVASLELGLFAYMISTVNDDTLWGLTKRKIKLANITWGRELSAIGTYFYTRTFDFAIDFETFDREEPSFGALALGELGANKTWVTAGFDPANPRHFSRYKDPQGDLRNTFHDAQGKPTDAASAAKIDVIYHEESNFLLLGIPTYL